MPSWSDVRKFLTRDKWEFVKHGAKHDHFRKVLENGDILRTMISRESGEIHGLWHDIRKGQLKCSQEYFNTIKSSGKWDGEGRGLNNDETDE